MEKWAAGAPGWVRGAVFSTSALFAGATVASTSAACGALKAANRDRNAFAKLDCSGRACAAPGVGVASAIAGRGGTVVALAMFTRRENASRSPSHAQAK